MSMGDNDFTGLERLTLLEVSVILGIVLVGAVAILLVFGFTVGF